MILKDPILRLPKFPKIRSMASSWWSLWKEDMELVEAAPKVVKEAAAKADAEELKKKLEEVGAKVTLK